MKINKAIKAAGIHNGKIIELNIHTVYFSLFKSYNCIVCGTTFLNIKCICFRTERVQFRIQICHGRGKTCTFSIPRPRLEGFLYRHYQRLLVKSFEMGKIKQLHSRNPRKAPRRLPLERRSQK